MAELSCLDSCLVVYHFAKFETCFMAFDFMYFEAMLLGTCIFMIVMSSWEVNSSIVRKYDSLSLVILFYLIVYFNIRYSISDSNKAILAFLCLSFVWYVFSIYLPSAYLCFYIKMCLINSIYLGLVLRNKKLLWIVSAF